MRTLARFSTWLISSVCLAFLFQANSATGSPLQSNAPKDSIRVQVESSGQPPSGSTFNLLPKFDSKKDTAGLQLIPKYDNSDNSMVMPLDKEPHIVKRVEPAYPEAAARAGLEGKVIVKMWVTTEGKVGQVVVLKSDAEIFNKPAIEAAKQFLFTPAYMNKKPVAVWVSYPFRFSLPQKK